MNNITHIDLDQVTTNPPVIKPALWFSRHTPTQEQLNQIHYRGYRLHNIEQGILWGQEELTEWPKINSLIRSILQTAKEIRAKAVFGVFPTPILFYMATEADFAIQEGGYPANYSIPCYASWNIQRPQENSKPTFYHKQWLYIGRLAY